MERPRGNGDRGPHGHQDAELQLPRHGVRDGGAVLAGLQEKRCWPVILFVRPIYMYTEVFNIRILPWVKA